MIERFDLIPLTVVAAGIIFLLKEILEAARRFAASRRKMHALRALLAAECERNRWTINWLRRQAPDIRDALREGLPISVKTTATGVQRLAFDTPGGGGSSPIPDAHAAVLDKYLFEAASLDVRLFARMEAALACTAELKHLRRGLFENVIDDQKWLEGWTEYAEEELETIENEMQRYTSYVPASRLCTGKPLTTSRLR